MPGRTGAGGCPVPRVSPPHGVSSLAEKPSSGRPLRVFRRPRTRLSILRHASFHHPSRVFPEAMAIFPPRACGCPSPSRVFGSPMARLPPGKTGGSLGSDALPAIQDASFGTGSRLIPCGYRVLPWPKTHETPARSASSVTPSRFIPRGLDERRCPMPHHPPGSRAHRGDPSCLTRGGLRCTRSGVPRHGLMDVRQGSAPRRGLRRGLRLARGPETTYSPGAHDDGSARATSWSEVSAPTNPEKSGVFRSRPSEAEEASEAYSRTPQPSDAGIATVSAERHRSSSNPCAPLRGRTARSPCGSASEGT